MGKAYLKKVKVINDLGLHARAAAKITRIAADARSNVWIMKDGMKADAKSVIDILTLGCEKEGVISVSVEIDQDADILEKIVELVEQGFGE